VSTRHGADEGTRRLGPRKDAPDCGPDVVCPVPEILVSAARDLCGFSKMEREEGAEPRCGYGHSNQWNPVSTADDRDFVPGRCVQIDLHSVA
jgi:hypothetical protein